MKSDGLETFVIIGAGGHGKVVSDLVFALDSSSSQLFLDKAFTHSCKLAFGQVVGSDDLIGEVNTDFFSFVVAIGDNQIRKKIYTKCVQSHCKMSTLVDPRACVSPKVKIGCGSMVISGATVNIDAEIGKNCIVNTGAIVEHDCRIGAHSHIAPGAILGGGAQIGDMALIGIGAKVLPYVKIGSNVTVGAGAVVTQDTPDGATVIGIPARPLKSL